MVLEEVNLEAFEIKVMTIFDTGGWVKKRVKDILNTFLDSIIIYFKVYQ